MENLKMLETFNKLKETIGEEATTEVVTLFDLKLNEMKEHLATKEDLERTKSQLILWIAGLLASATVVNQLLNYFM